MSASLLPISPNAFCVSRNRYLLVAGFLLDIVESFVDFGIHLPEVVHFALEGADLPQALLDHFEVALEELH